MDSPLPLRKLGGDRGDFPNRALDPPIFDTLGATFLPPLLFLVGVLAGAEGKLCPAVSVLMVEVADKGLAG